MMGLDPGAFTSTDATHVYCAARTIPSKCERVIGARFRSPINLSILTVPTSPGQIVEYGLSALAMIAVSYVVWGMSVQRRGMIEQSTGGPQLKFFIFFVVFMYLLATVAFGVKHYFGHPGQGFFDAVAVGIAWPGVLVEMARHPSF